MGVAMKVVCEEWEGSESSGEWMEAVVVLPGSIRFNSEPIEGLGLVGA